MREWASRRRTSTVTGGPISSSRTRAARATRSTPASSPSRPDRPSTTSTRRSRRRSARPSPAGAFPGSTSTSTASPTSCSPTAESRSRISRGTPSRSRCSRTWARLPGSPPRFTDGTALVGGNDLPRVVGRGLTTADFDNDGRMDIAINTIGGKLELLRPTGAVGHWLAVRLARFSPGAVVTAVLPDGRRLVREVQAGSSYLSSQDPRVHFGLGSATSVSQLSVRYPNGRVVERNNVAADHIVVFRPAGRSAALARPGRSQRPAATAPYLIAGCTRSDLQGALGRPSLGRGHARRHQAGHYRRRPLTRGTSSTSLPQCGTPGPPTTRRRTATSSPRKTRPRRRGCQRGRDQLCGIPRSPLALLVRRQYASSPSTSSLGPCARSATAWTSRARRATHRRALGNRIAAAAIRYGRSDGALERLHFADESYVPVNAPLVVNQPGTAMHDATFWQPLALDQTVSQNGLAVPGKVQTFIGAQWGHVRGFALPSSKNGVPIDPGPPPIGTPADAAYKQAAVDIIRKSADLDPADGKTIDIGLDGFGNNPLGTNDGHWLHGQSGDGSAICARACAPGRLCPGPGRVLGGRTELGDSARPLERDCQHRLGLAARGARIGGREQRTACAGTSRCTSPSTAPCTTPRSPRGG